MDAWQCIRSWGENGNLSSGIHTATVGGTIYQAAGKTLRSSFKSLRTSEVARTYIKGGAVRAEPFDKLRAGLP